MESIETIYENLQKQKSENYILNSEMFQPSNSLVSTSEIEMSYIQNLSSKMKADIGSELFGFGPLESLLLDTDVSEIVVNGFNEIYFEKGNHLFKADQIFLGQQTYNQFVERLCQNCNTFLNREKPFVEFQIDKFRITIIYGELSRGDHLISIRKKKDKMLSFQNLIDSNWCTYSQSEILNSILRQRNNFLIVGGTGSGKTTVLQSLMMTFKNTERVIIIEDTQELVPPNGCSISLLTQNNFHNPLENVSMECLLKRSLRLRPDRIAIGEVRGSEAKALLMALSTGHDGSFGSLHARNAHEALLRLEMLIQMGAPEWSLESIQRLIGLTIQNIIVLEKRDDQRRLAGVYEVSSVEQNGITLHELK